MQSAPSDKSPRHVLCIYLPGWTLVRRYRRQPAVRRGPVAVIRSIGQRRLVVDASPAARELGVAPALNAAEARALCPGLLCIEEDLPGDRRALDALGRWLTRFTPIVARGWDGDEEQMPPALFLNLSGCERLFGGIGPLVDQIGRSLRRLGIPAQMAVAPTVGAAWALAFADGSSPRIIDDADLPAAVQPLPVGALRLKESVVADLLHLGLYRIGDMLALPRRQLPSRFGPTLLTRLDQLTGALAEPLTKLVVDWPIQARAEFDAPIEALEDIWRICQKLLALVVSDLAARQHGVRRLRLTFSPDRCWGKPIVTRTINLSRPHRHLPTLWELIRGETERIDCDRGFIRFQLDVPLHEQISDAQVELFDPRSVQDKLELDRLFQRLRGQLGDQGVGQPEFVESYLPERGWKADGLSLSSPSPGTPGEGWGEGIKNPHLASTLNAQKTALTLPGRGQSPNPLPSPGVPGEGKKRRRGRTQKQPLRPTPLPSHRPLTLFPMPIEIRVVCEPSDDRTGHPRQIAWQSGVHRLIHIVGPERIAGEWWRGHHRTRDYFDVEDDEGRRLWIFRVLRARNQEISARWFIHGRFD